MEVAGIANVGADQMNLQVGLPIFSRTGTTEGQDDELVGWVNGDESWDSY